MDKFFVVLPSDSSMEIYPENKLSNYTTNIPNEIKVDPSKWEVALQEIQFPHTWFNIRKGHNKIHKIYYELSLEENIGIVESYPDDIIPVDSNQMIREIKIPHGNYEQIEHLIEKLNKKEKEDPHPFTYRYEKHSGKVIIKMPSRCGISFGKSDIARCLGFKQEKEFKHNREEGFIQVESDTIISKNPIHSVYLYTDIIENQYVGDYKVPLLRVIPVRAKFNEINWMHYDKPHFLRLSRENIDDIEINIRDETGEFVSFESGKVIVTLVFRRISTRFYQ